MNSAQALRSMGSAAPWLTGDGIPEADLDESRRFTQSFDERGTPMNFRESRSNSLSKGWRALACGLSLGGLVTLAASAEAPESEEGKTLYFIGVMLADQPPFEMLETSEVEVVLQGLRDGSAGNATELDPQVYGPKLQALIQERASQALGVEKAKGRVHLEKAASEDGAVITDSGLVIREVKPGTGDSPKASDTVKVHYEGTFADGTVFDSSLQRGQPVEFPLSGVIPCWTEGVGTMKEGGKSRLTCPSDLAYGDQGAPPRIPGGAVLSFDVELIEIID
ncbi:FKBP-type peptidyl-prolyl cis-trans isomerase [Myxococcota bacterium]|nr:FKBP-type peptidyl-prolyl cis-trans isomerase [Myxococcota bacterium]